MPMGTSDVCYEMRQAVRHISEQRSDVVHQVRGIRRLLDDPPYDESYKRICEYRPQ